jgi:hypothetical protein
LLVEVSNCVSKQDFQSTLQLQLRPLFSSLTSLEKVIQIQEDRREREQSPSLSPSVSSSKKSNWTYEKIQRVIDDYFLERYPHLSHVVTSLSLDTHLLQQKEYFLTEINRKTDELRNEIEVNEREFLLSVKKKYEDRFQEIFGNIREVKDISLQNQNGLKDLAGNVAKAVSKKVDRGDIPRIIHEYAEGIHPISPHSHPRNSLREREREKPNGNSRDRRRESSPSLSPSGSSSIFRKKNSHDLTLKSSYRPHHSEDDSESENEEQKKHSQQKNKKSAKSQNPNIPIETLQSLQKETNELRQLLDRYHQEMNMFKEEYNNSEKVKEEWGKNKGKDRERDRERERDGTYIANSSSMYTDWRRAMGELSLNLRREMSDKCGREEMRSAIGIEMNLLEKKLHVRLNFIPFESDQGCH